MPDNSTLAPVAQLLNKIDVAVSTVIINARCFRDEDLRKTATGIHPADRNYRLSTKKILLLVIEELVALYLKEAWARNKNAVFTLPIKGDGKYKSDKPDAERGNFVSLGC